MTRPPPRSPLFPYTTLSLSPPLPIKRWVVLVALPAAGVVLFFVVQPRDPRAAAGRPPPAGAPGLRLGHKEPGGNGVPARGKRQTRHGRLGPAVIALGDGGCVQHLNGEHSGHRRIEQRRVI